MKKSLIVVTLILSLLIFPEYALSWSSDTHKAITEQVEKQSGILDQFLVKLGFSKGAVETKFKLSSSYPAPMRIWKTTRPALDWLLKGSVREDFPITRAQNHFHDPTTLEGLS